LASWAASHKHLRIRRVGTTRSGFRYVDEHGRPVSVGERARIRALRIPPAWRGVRIASDPRAPLQAVGIDGAGRRQYWYHPRAAERRQRAKFQRLTLIAPRISRLRERARRAVAHNGLTRRRVVAGALLLVQDHHVRPGSERYARRHGSYGATTLRVRHVVPHGRHRFLLRFTGKSGQRHVVLVEDARLARLLDTLRRTPRARVFQYRDGRVWRRIRARDLNQYVQAHVHPEARVKDLRTWAGTLHAARTLDRLGAPRNPTDAKRKAVQAVREVAKRLGNTPAVARRYYIHPDVLEAHARGRTLSMVRLRGRPAHGLTRDEAALLRLLTQESTSPSQGAPRSARPAKVPP
jgi:DNA topoisomerase I